MSIQTSRHEKARIIKAWRSGKNKSEIAREINVPIRFVDAALTDQNGKKFVRSNPLNAGAKALTEKQRAALILLWRGGFHTQQDLAKKFNISRFTVRGMVGGIRQDIGALVDQYAQWLVDASPSIRNDEVFVKQLDDVFQGMDEIKRAIKKLKPEEKQIFDKSFTDRKMSEAFLHNVNGRMINRLDARMEELKNEPKTLFDLAEAHHMSAKAMNVYGVNIMGNGNVNAILPPQQAATVDTGKLTSAQAMAELRSMGLPVQQPVTVTQMPQQQTPQPQPQQAREIPDSDEWEQSDAQQPEDQPSPEIDEAMRRKAAQLSADVLRKTQTRENAVYFYSSSGILFPGKPADEDEDVDDNSPLSFEPV